MTSRANLRRLQYHGTRRQTLHAPRLSATFAARSFDRSGGYLSRQSSTESYCTGRRPTFGEPSVEALRSRRGRLGRESSTESYQKRLRKRMDSVASETTDKCGSSAQVLYEEEPCYIDEDDERGKRASERTSVSVEVEKRPEPSPAEREDDERKKSGRPARKTYGSARQLTKQAAVDDDDDDRDSGPDEASREADATSAGGLGLTEEESVRQVIAERRKIDLMRPEPAGFNASVESAEPLLGRRSVESADSPTALS